MHLLIAVSCIVALSATRQVADDLNGDYWAKMAKDVESASDDLGVPEPQASPAALLGNPAAPVTAFPSGTGEQPTPLAVAPPAVPAADPIPAVSESEDADSTVSTAYKPGIDDIQGRIDQAKEELIKMEKSRAAKKKQKRRGTGELDAMENRIEAAKDEFRALREHEDSHASSWRIPRNDADGGHERTNQPSSNFSPAPAGAGLDGMESALQEVKSLKSDNAALRRQLENKESKMGNVVQTLNHHLSQATVNFKSQRLATGSSISGAYIAVLVFFDVLVFLCLYANRQGLKARTDDAPDGNYFIKARKVIDVNMYEIVALLIVVEVGLVLIKSQIFGSSEWTQIPGEIATVSFVLVGAYLVHRYFNRKPGELLLLDGAQAEPAKPVQAGNTSGNVYDRFKPGNAEPEAVRPGSQFLGSGPSSATSVDKRKNGMCC